MASSHSDRDDNSQDEFEDWGSEVESVPIRSLVGKHYVSSANEAWDELKQLTGFDAQALIAGQRLPAYSVVRLVNHLRRGLEAALARGDVDGSGRVTSTAATAVVSPSSQFARGSAMWADEGLLQPVLGGDGEQDGLLLAALEAADDEDDAEEASAGAAAGAGSQPGSAAAAGAGQSVSSSHGPSGQEVLQAQVKALQEELAGARQLLARMLAGGPSGDSTDSEDDASESGSESGSDNGAAAGQHRGSNAAAGAGPSKPKGPDNDSYYFNSYSGSGIHAEMLQDAVRTDAYRRALLGLGQAQGQPAGPASPEGSAVPAPDQPSWLRGKRVLDVGCGTGILSIFSARAGAAQVTGLDASGVVHDARAIAASNGLDNSVTIVQGKCEDYIRGRLAGHPSPSPVDAIVSEWMGYGLLYENMLPGVLEARDALLAPGGVMMPSHAHIRVAAVRSPEVWSKHVGWWRSVYGVDMSRMARHGQGEAAVEVVPKAAMATGPMDEGGLITTLRMLTVTNADLDVVNRPFRLALPDPGSSSPATPPVVHGLVLWFDIDFAHDPKPAPGSAGATAASGSGGLDDLPELEDNDGSSGAGASAVAVAPVPASGTAAEAGNPPVSFSTGPHVTPTHWMQTLLLFPEPLATPAASVLVGTLSMVRDGTNPRQYHFHVTARVEGPAPSETKSYSWKMN